MKSIDKQISELVVEVFNDILCIEEQSLKKSRFSDITISELHAIEVIGLHYKKSMTEIAKNLGITIGTLTISINNLVRKGYVKRFKDEADKRVVMVGLTKDGKVLYRMHEKFHRDIITGTILDFDKEHQKNFLSALTNLHLHLKDKYES